MLQKRIVEIYSNLLRFIILGILLYNCCARICDFKTVQAFFFLFVRKTLINLASQVFSISRFFVPPHGINYKQLFFRMHWGKKQTAPVTSLRLTASASAKKRSLSIFPLPRSSRNCVTFPDE